MLPESLKKLRSKRYLTAFVILLLSASTAVICRDACCMLLLLFSFWFFYLGFCLEREYRIGKIAESAFICTDVKSSAVLNSTRLSFKEETGSGQILQIKQKSYMGHTAFHTGNKYILYYLPGPHAVLLAFESVE